MLRSARRARLARMKLFHAFLLLALPALGAACRTTSPQPRELREFTLCHLVTGPRSAEIEKEESDRVFAGHMQNIGRLAADHSLLVAGPFGDPRSDANHRGIFVFDTPDPKVAESWTATDPAIQAGALGMELVRFTTEAPLDRFPEIYEAYMEERGDAGDEMKTFVIATTADEQAGRRAVESLGERCVISGTTDDPDMRWFLVVDHATPAEAAAVLDEDVFALSSWWSSASLLRVAGSDA